MHRRAYLAGLGSAAVVGLAGCLSSSPLDDGEYDIGMESNRFVPDEYEISVGETVVWGNTGSRGHTVTAADGGIPEGAEYFASGEYESYDAAEAAWREETGGRIDVGETYEHTFETPGEYYYVCIPHINVGMDGTIVVTE